MVVLRHLAWRSVVPFTLSIMRAAASEAFHRVQRLSTDWHANSFSGSLVRKVTRGMWAFDALDDVVLLALLPSLVALFGTVALMASRWPVLGAVMALGAVAYIALTVKLATKVLAPAARLSNQWDTRVGGLLADAIGTNAVVKAFAGEAREDARLGHVLDKWSRRTRRTWLRFTWSGTGKLALLWTIRAGVTGTALWLWAGGQASAGDVVYVLTAYLVLHGYLRDIGQHVHHLQRAVNEMEELALLTRNRSASRTRPRHGRSGSTPARSASRASPSAMAAMRRRSTRRSMSPFRAGQRVGLVGHSGSGKTTFVKLIQRLYDVTGGRIWIDGRTYAWRRRRACAGRSRSCRRSRAVPPQPGREYRLWPAGRDPGRDRAAARLANAPRFHRRLPRGYRTLVGERGVKLSGGERQRVALARPFLATRRS
jgi:ATP-binding cassette subfamily B protein